MDNSYWKVSPDPASTIGEMQQHNQYDFVIGQHQSLNSNENLQIHHRTTLDHNRNGSGNIPNGHGPEEVDEDLVVIHRQNPPQHLIVTASHIPHTSNQQHGTPPSSTGSIVVASSAYDTVTKTAPNSAFTPINVIPTHLNSLQHHQLAQRPLYYDAIAFPNKNIPQNAPNGFPNQLISLHQIRNYAHQPGGEHFLGIAAGGGSLKDKGP
jgi:zinc finger protein 362/384